MDIIFAIQYYLSAKNINAILILAEAALKANLLGDGEKTFDTDLIFELVLKR